MMRKLDRAMAAWHLDDGGTEGKVRSAIENDRPAHTRWGVWLPSVNFGRVLDFSCEGAYAAADGRDTALYDHFTLSAFAMLPPRENTDRVLLAQGEAPRTEYYDVTSIIAFDPAREKWHGDASLTHGQDLCRRAYAQCFPQDKPETVSRFADMTVEFDAPRDFSAYRDGVMAVDIMMDDVNNLPFRDRAIEMRDADGHVIHWDINGLNSGTNTQTFALSDYFVGEADLSRIVSFRCFVRMEKRTYVRLYGVRLMKQRTVRTAPSWRLYAQKDTGYLTFEADGMEGLAPSGIPICDGRWHHIAVNCEGGRFTYFVDGKAARSLGVSGSVACAFGPLWIGGFGGFDTLDGSLTQAAIYRGAFLPNEITDTVFDDAREPVKPTLELKRGLTLDRRQLLAPTPKPSEPQVVRLADIDFIIKMGFDHVKLLLTPNQLEADDGSFIEGNLVYIDRLVDYVCARRFKCIVCLHPEPFFKPRQLCESETNDRFEKLVRWYGEFGKAAARHWDPRFVAIQLMTESGANTPEDRWTWMSDRIWGAVRNACPEHTLICSSDRFGNIERLKLMSPASDTNLVYSYTSYEPYTIGWYWYAEPRDSFWKKVHDIPYPIEHGVDYTEAVERAIDRVPEEQKAEARRCLTNYVKGIDDGGHAYYKNNYPELYNRNWHFLRAKSLDDWRKKYGGKIAIMVVEWGCMDRGFDEKRCGAEEGCGIPDATRIEFTRDTRESLEAYDIGWTMWSYNEAHTVFKPDNHAFYTTPTPEEFKEWYDRDLIEDALGLVYDEDR